MSSRVTAHFQLTGFSGSPAEITAALAMRPTRTWRAGEPVGPGTSVPHRNNAWILDSPLRGSDDVAEHVEAVLARLRGNWPEAVRLCRQYEAQMHGVIRYYGEAVPPISFSAETLRQLAELGALLDVDFYVLGGGEP